MWIINGFFAFVHLPLTKADYFNKVGNIKTYVYARVLGCALRQADSGFFCEGYSSDEDVLVKEEFRGNIIKQGCLLKQVNLKTNTVFCHL